MSHLIDVLVVTYNNPQYLYPCVSSLLGHQTTAGLIKITVINNGDPDSVKYLPKHVDVIQMKENAHWVGGLKAGFDKTSAPFVLLCNDDIFVPPSSGLWPNQLLQHFVYPDCAAVGPASNFAMGQQGIWGVGGPTILRVPFLIGFFMLIRREDLIKAGGLDASFKCGDDMDLSMRLRDLGKYLIADKEVFIFHHGAKTGSRVEGGYWYSAEQQEKTWMNLFLKHGVKHTHEMLMSPFTGNSHAESFYTEEDSEGKMIVPYVPKDGTVIELGCGNQKTVPQAIGVDVIPRGEMIPALIHQVKSVADVVGDVQGKLPFASGSAKCIIARHILEHCSDPIEAVNNWVDLLETGGRLIVAVPDQTLHSTIPMNSEHVHAYTPKSLSNLFKTLGFKEIDIKPSGNNISIVGVFEKNGIH